MGKIYIRSSFAYLFHFLLQASKQPLPALLQRFLILLKQLQFEIPEPRR